MNHNLSKTSGKAALICLGLIVLAGALFRSYDLGSEAFDCDELYAVRIQGVSPKALAMVVARDGFHTNHPPLMTVPYLFWTAILGTGEGLVRLLPFICSTITILVVYALGAQLGGRTVGLFAAAAMAVNPLNIAYAQEARQYALLTLLVATAHLAFCRYLQGGRLRDLRAYILSCLLAALTHYFAVVALTAHALVGIWLSCFGDQAFRRKGLHVLMALLLAALPCFAWLPVTIFQSGIKWRHLMLADFSTISLCLRDVVGVRTPYEHGLLGASVSISLIVAGFWGFRTKPLEPSLSTDDGPPLPIGMSRLVFACGMFGTAAAVFGPWTTPILNIAGATLDSYGYTPEQISSELRVVRQVLIAIPFGAVLAGLFAVAWRQSAALGGRLLDRWAACRSRLSIGRDRPPSGALIVGAMILAPILATRALGLLEIPLLQTRNLIVLTPSIAIGLGMGFATLARSPLGRVAALPAAAVLLLAGGQYHSVSAPFGGNGYRLGIHTYNWHALSRYLHQSDVPKLPMLSAKTASSDPLLFYLKWTSPRRIEPTDVETAYVPERFYVTAVESDPDHARLLDELRRRGFKSTPVFQENRLVLHKMTKQ